MNPFYNVTGNPQVLSRGASALIRSEFLAIQNGFAKVANVAGINSSIDTGTANAYVVTPVPPVVEYGQFVSITFIAGNTNTGASTINANGLGAINITRRDGSALLAGDIISGGVYTVTGDGTNVQLQANPLSGNATGPINAKGPINFGKSNSVASASTVVLDSMTANYGHITGATTINAITLGAGSIRQVVFDGILTLTNGADLVLPGAQNITTAQGDIATFVGDGAGVVLCVSYTNASGYSIVESGLVKLASFSLGSPALAVNFLNSFSSKYSSYILEINNLTPQGGGSAAAQPAIQMAIAGILDSGNNIIGAGISSNSHWPTFGAGGVLMLFTGGSQNNPNPFPSLNSIINFTNTLSNSGSVGIFSETIYYSDPYGLSFDVCGANYSGGLPSGFRVLSQDGTTNFAAGTTFKLYGKQA